MDNSKTGQNTSPTIAQDSFIFEYIYRIFLGTTLAFAFFAIYNYFFDTSSISHLVYSLGYQQHLMNTPAYISKLNSVIYVLNFLTSISFWMWCGFILGYTAKILVKKIKICQKK